MTIFRRILFILIIFVSGNLVAQTQKVGVMIMAHGGSPQWNNLVVQAAQPLSQKYKVAYAWGMGDPKTLQKAVDELEAGGVTRIIAVPLFISSYSPVIRQTEFLLGLRDKLADAPMPSMDHSGGAHQMGGGMSGHNMHASMNHGSHGAAESEELKPLKIKAQLTVTPALDDNAVVASILRDRIAELSTNPPNETVILVAHGPNNEEDNNKWINNMESLSEKVEKLQEAKGKKYKQIFAVTVRDDADKAIFDQAKEQLRAVVRQAGKFGNVIVVPLFLSSGGREQAVAERLEGLTYKWSGKALLPDSSLTDFLSSSISGALSK
ncbi:MAG: hypothetical protein H3C48_16335 [Chitinophagaceae bacterium]|nr:hypothetical protein [Chitinophagaceae bacterium]